MPEEFKIDTKPGEAPKRFVRTFASDAEALKSGGAPDFKDLPPSPSTGVPPLAVPEPAPAPAAPTLSDPNLPPPTKLPASPAVSYREPIPTPKPAPEPVALPTPPPLPTRDENRPVPLHTYESDFADQIQSEQASTASIIAAEQDATPRAIPVGERRVNLLYVLAGIGLLVLGLGGTYAAFLLYQSQAEPVAISFGVSAPIFVEEREQIAGTDGVLMQAIEQSVTRPLPANSIRLLYTDEATTTDRSVFSALQLPAPNVLLRNIDAEQSMAGVLNSGGSQTPFFLLSVASYGDTFAGMLGWEARMPSDLGPLFHAYPAPETAATSTATSTPLTLKSKEGFRDEVIANHDTRVYRDSAGRAVLLYGYWNPTTLIIARDEGAFVDIINRIANSRSSQ